MVLAVWVPSAHPREEAWVLEVERPSSLALDEARSGKATQLRV